MIMIMKIIQYDLPVLGMTSLVNAKYDLCSALEIAALYRVITDPALCMLWVVAEVGREFITYGLIYGYGQDNIHHAPPCCLLY